MPHKHAMFLVFRRNTLGDESTILDGWSIVVILFVQNGIFSNDTVLYIRLQTMRKWEEKKVKK